MRCFVSALFALAVFGAFGRPAIEAAEAPPASVGEPPPGTEIVHPADGSVMVWVPSGHFIMGMDRQAAQRLASDLGYKDYHVIAAEEWFPRRRVYVEGFFIDRCEVTSEQWARFVKATDYKPAVEGKAPQVRGDTASALLPVAGVTWADAQRYANWAGKALPTEKQWEKAARGTDGRLYPWGNEPLSQERGVLVDLKTGGPTAALPVGSHPKGASPYGCMDMAGNLYEWTSEWMEPYPNNPERERLLSYMGHRFGCLRGGSFYHGPYTYACAKRFGLEPDETYFHVGFRTVWEPPEGYFTSGEFEEARATVAARKGELEALRTR